MSLTLRRASTSRPSGSWQDEDYNVFDGEREIGRIPPPMPDQPATLAWCHLIFFDRARDGGLFVRRVFDDADEFRGRVEDQECPRGCC